MKKLFYMVIALAAVAITSCQNENTVTPRPSEQIVSKVTISGRVKAELNTTNTTTENVPDGIKVIAEISTRDLALNPNNNLIYPNKYYETTVRNGEYTLEVEVGPNGTDVIVYFPAFRADVVNAAPPTPVSTIFVGNNFARTLLKGKNEILDYTY
jgi:hypothetical protein